MSTISVADQALILDGFVSLWGKRLSALIHGSEVEQPDSKAQLRSFHDAVAAIATDQDASSTLEAAAFEDGNRKIRSVFKFDTTDARKAQKTIEARKRELDATENADHVRVLMYFTRSDINTVDIGKRSGELVKIDRISDKALPLMYGSNLAEQRIKHEITEADDNIFKKGFSVDVNVELRGGEPKAYSVTAVHQVLDLPDD